MDAPKPNKPGTEAKSPTHPFRKAVLRGLAVVFPPLLTILIFGWVISTTYQYIFGPVTLGVREAIVWSIAEVRTDLEPDPPGGETAAADGKVYHRVDGAFVPEAVYEKVATGRGDTPMPQTPKGVYRVYVELTYLRAYYAIPFFLATFILLLYLLGKFIAAGIGAFFWTRFERLIHRLPLIRNVYSSVKQVSDFLFTEREVEYNRVVAVEYPRKGSWSLGFVTGDSLADIRSAANEPVLSVLIPTSPMPMTGFTITVLKSETVDLDITIDQAFQYIVSCGVVIPPQQLWTSKTPQGLPVPGGDDGAALLGAPTASQPADPS